MNTAAERQNGRRKSMRPRVRGLVAATATLGLGAAIALSGGAAANAQAYSACNTLRGILTCIYDGHTSTGKVVISATVTNQNSKNVILTSVIMHSDPTTWTVWGGNGEDAGTVIKAGQTLGMTKNFTTTSWKGRVLAGWSSASADGGIEPPARTW